MKTQRQGLAAGLKGWRQLLGFCSIIASLPAMLVSHVLKARAEEAKRPEATVAGLTARIRERLTV